MNEDKFNMSLRKFLKQVGVTSQREIEQGVRGQIDAGNLSGNERLPARATVTVEGLPEPIVVEGEIALG